MENTKFKKEVSVTLEQKEINDLNKKYDRLLSMQAKGILVDEEQIKAVEYLLYIKSNGN